MQRGRGGYTIIEVMVVLAVGMVTFIAAVSLFAGKQGKTEFSQAMRDIQTKIQSIVNDVGVSNYPLTAGYECTLSGGWPVLTSPSGETGTNTDCIFLGKAVNIIHPNNGPHRFVIYTVLGTRVSEDDKPPTTYDDEDETGVNPNPVLTDSLTESYNLPFGVKANSARADTHSGTYMLGFYNSLQASATTDQGSQSLTTIGYIGFNSTAPGQIRNTIRGIIGTQENSKAWTICFQSGTSEEEAELVVNSSFSGVTTIINYTNC